jgi:hypothetical protein
VCTSKRPFCKPRALSNTVADSSPGQPESYDDISINNPLSKTRKGKYDLFNNTSNPLQVLDSLLTLAAPEVPSLEERPTARPRTENLSPNPSCTLTQPPIIRITTPEAYSAQFLPLSVGSVKCGGRDDDTDTLDLLLFSDIKVATPVSQPLPSTSSQFSPSTTGQDPGHSGSVSEGNETGFPNLPPKDLIITNEEDDYLRGHSHEEAKLLLSLSQPTSSFEAVEDKQDISLNLNRRIKKRQGSSYSNPTSQDALHSVFSEDEDETEYEDDKTEDASNDDPCFDGLICKGNMRLHKKTRLPWLESDEQRLLSYKNKMGMVWGDIFERFPDRTPGAIRSRYRMLAAKDMEYDVEEVLESVIRHQKLQYRASGQDTILTPCGTMRPISRTAYKGSIHFTIPIQRRQGLRKGWRTGRGVLLRTEMMRITMTTMSPKRTLHYKTAPSRTARWFSVSAVLALPGTSWI